MFRRIEIAIIFVSLLVTFGFFAESRRSSSQAAEIEFNRITEDSVQALQTRMNIYLQSLNSAAGMMRALDDVTLDDFETLATSLDLETQLPGINGIGFIEPVAASELADFVVEMRENGNPDFAPHPETESAEKYIIKHIAPLGPNRQALGLDISFEQGRRTAADLARETGLPQLTPRILLVQDDAKTPGFLLLRPLFNRENDLDSGFRGWVYAPFIGRNLLADLTPNRETFFEIEVFDGAQTEPDTLIFSSEFEEENLGAYAASRMVNFFGRPWMISYRSTPTFDRVFTNRTSIIILVAGILLSAMLAYLMRALRLHNKSVSEMASLRGRQISAQESQNRSLIENAVVAVMILDHDRRILFANHAAVECFGYRKDGMADLQIGDVVTIHTDLPEDAGYNGTGRTLTGDLLYLDVQQNDWVTLDGVRRVTMMVRDVTAEVSAVTELAKTKERYHLALDGSDIGVFEIDLSTGTSIVSETWRRIMGVSGDTEDTQGVFMNRIHPDDLPRLFAEDRKCIAGETDRSLCEYRMDFDGAWRWMRSDAVVVDRAPDGKALRLLGTQVDVTQIRHARNALEESEERFRTALEAAPVGMAILDSEANFISVNAALSKLTGYEKEEMIETVTLRHLLPEAERKNMRDTVFGAIAQGRKETYSAEHRILRKDGAERWGLFNVTWTFDKNTQAYVFIVQVNDITDKKKIEQIKGEFVSTVSHELRTPLTSIKGALGLIEASSKDTLTASTRRLIDIAKTNAIRLTEIVNDILDLEKISSGEINFDIAPVSMNDLVRASVDQMIPFAVTHHNQLVADLPETPIAVLADRGRLIQVLANLISNACKYSDDDSDVRVIVEELDDVAITYVQNIGPGVPESFRNRIFEAFSQADSSDTRARGGTGLGLNITRQIVHRMGGEIGFESKPNGPTVFWFTCPIARGEEANTAEIMTRADLNDAKRLKVLHVEDDTDFAEVIRTGLSPFADVSSATHLRSARLALQEGPLDVVIVDWTLPDGDGADLINDIQNTHPKARIVGLSSDASQRKESGVAVNLLKSRTEMAQIIETVTFRAKQAV